VFGHRAVQQGLLWVTALIGLHTRSRS
jgi:hypothetical protein